MTAASPPGRSGAYGPRRRKEDARFIRGRGNYVDDIALPGMLHGAVLRSPLAHARITAIDTLAAEAHPKVRAVITGQMLAERGLAWMPTISGDVQAVLATDKVRFQGQEVAFVVAEDRYAARDALELIDVTYEPLPPVVDARLALDPDSPLIRDDIAGQADNRIFDWEAGDRAAADRVFAAAEVTVAQDMLYPRVHPAPLETCGAVAAMDPVTGQLTIWSTSQAPHAHRTMYALITGLPEHKIRIISPDIGGGFGNKVAIYPGYLCAVVGSIITGQPVKWMEDRSENLMSTSFARDYHMHGEIAATRDGRILGLRVRVLADHGAFNGAAQPTKFPAGFFGVFTGSYALQAAHCEVTGVYTNKSPGGVAYSCSFRVTEAVYLVERMVDVLARELGIDPAELRMKNLLRPAQFPYRSATGWEYDSGDYPRALRLALDMAGYPELRREQAERARARRADGHRDQLLHRGGRGRPARADGHPRPGHGRRRGPAGTPHRQGRARHLGADPGPGARDDVRPDRRARSWGCPPMTWRWCTATPTGRRSGWAPTGPGPPRCPARRPRWWRARCASGPGSSPRPCWRPRRRPGMGRRPVAGPRRPGPGQDHRRDRDGGALRPGAAGRGGGPPGRGHRLQPAEPDLPVRRLHLRGGRRSGHRRGGGAPVHRGGRLRGADQPDDRRGPGARRAGRRPRHGADAGDRVRRRRQLPGRLVHGLPAAHVDGMPVLGAGRRPSPRRRTIRSGPRAWASRPRSARPPPWSTPWWTRSRRSACGTLTCR